MDWLHKWQIIGAKRWDSRFMSHVGIRSRVEDLVGQFESMCLISDSVTMLKSMRKSKNRYFYNIFVSSGDAPGAIMLNVVWMKREFDAYKLSRCMCPSIYNRF